jgi:hypothetical protein
MGMTLPDAIASAKTSSSLSAVGTHPEVFTAAGNFTCTLYGISAIYLTA